MKPHKTGGSRVQKVGCRGRFVGHFSKEGVNPGERHSRDFGRPLTKKVMSHSRGGPGVTAPLWTNIVPLTGVWNTPLPLPPLKVPDFRSRSELLSCSCR